MSLGFSTFCEGPQNSIQYIRQCRLNAESIRGYVDLASRLDDRQVIVNLVFPLPARR